MADSIRYDIKINNQQGIDSLNQLWAEARNGSEQAQYAINQRLGGTVKTEIVFETTVDDKGIKTLQAASKETLTAFDKLNNKQKQLNKTQEGSVTSLRQQVNAAKQLRDGIAKVATVTDEAAGTVAGELNPAWAAADDQVKSLSASLARANGDIMGVAKAQFPIIGQVLSLGNAFTQLTFIAKGVIEVFQAINAAVQPLINRAKQIEGLTLSLSAFLSTQSDVNAVLASAKGISLEYGTSLTQIERGYKRIAPAILAAGGSLSDVEAVVESLAAKTVQLGLNTEQSGRYIEAFAQVMGKGKLQAEELNQQFSELDGALRSQVALYLEAEYGITDLNSAMRNGEVTAERFSEAFVFAARSARQQLSGALGEIQTRLDSMNISQIENVRATLNTITLEGLNNTFDGFGMAMQRVATTTSQFFASFANNMPALAQFWQDLSTFVGNFVAVVWQGFLNGITIAVTILDRFYGIVNRIIESLRNIPGVSQAMAFLSDVGQNIARSFWEGSDAIMGLGETVNIAKGGFEDLQVSAEILKQQLDAGVISAGQYERGLNQLYSNATNNSKALLGAFEAEEAKLKELKEQTDARFEAENEKIKENIDLKKEALQDEKDALKEVTDNLKENYEERRSAIQEETDAIKEKYDLELENATQLTAAQKEEKRLRREKLEAILRSSEASYEEKVQAEATLDRLDQQVERENIKLRRAEELKQKEKEQADLRKQYDADRKKAEEESEQRQKAITAALEKLTDELKSNEQKQKDYNKQIEESTRLVNDQIDSLDDIPGLLDTQIGKVNDARDAYWEAAEAAQALSDQIRLAEQAQGNGTRTRRASGGPVAGGQVYTVNEYGKEGFLSASGKLSQINAPSWGDWRAPGAGTVIPADIFATMKATGAANTASRAAGVVSRASGTGGDLLRALRNYGSGDSIQNNVTIQAANTTQAASDMLVQLTKIKRRRIR
jgi:tape measure domain-containing protein